MNGLHKFKFRDEKSNIQLQLWTTFFLFYIILIVLSFARLIMWCWSDTLMKYSHS